VRGGVQGLVGTDELGQRLRRDRLAGLCLGPGAGGEHEVGVATFGDGLQPLRGRHAPGVEAGHADDGLTALDEQADREAGPGRSVDEVPADRQTVVLQQRRHGVDRTLRSPGTVAERVGEQIGHVAAGGLAAPGHDDERAEVSGAESAVFP
jgi:hypothetical protein